MDQDGHEEFLVFSALDVARLMVFESGSPSSYDLVWSRDVPAGGLNWGSLATGDVDGDGVNEFAYSTSGLLALFKCTGPDSYEVAWSQDSKYRHLQLV